MAKKQYGFAGAGCCGDWDVNVDKELNDGTFQLVLDHEGMSLSDDGTQVQIDLDGDPTQTLEDLIDSLKQAKEDLKGG